MPLNRESRLTVPREEDMAGHVRKPGEGGGDEDMMSLGRFP